MPRADLSDLDAFAAVAAARSFRTAARLRGVSPSALSQAMRRLEDRLSIRLLHRTTRSVTLTDAGQRLLHRIAPALGEVAAAIDSVGEKHDRITGTLRLNVPTVVADLILPPLLARFLSLHPGIRVEVAAEDDFIDVLAAGFDAGVRYDERMAQDMIAVPIGPRVQRFMTAAAPSYWLAQGRPLHPRDLLRHRAIRHRFRSLVLPPWEFARAGETIRVDPPARVIANLKALEIEAAAAGLGVVHTFDGFLAPALAAGALEPVLEDWSERFSGPFLYYAGRRHLPPPLAAFIAFLRSPEAVWPDAPVWNPLSRETDTDSTNS